MTWHLLAAPALTLAIQIARKAPITKVIWQQIPEGYRWSVPIISGAAVAVAEALNAGVTETVALHVAALQGAVGVGVLSAGLHAVAKDSPLPWDGGRGGRVAPNRD